MQSDNKSLVQSVVPIIGGFYITIGIIGFFVTGFSNFVEDGNDKLVKLKVIIPVKSLKFGRVQGQ